MNTEPVGLVEIDQALNTLSIIARIRDTGRKAFDDSQERQWAVAYLWIAIGSALKQFCRVRGIDQGAPVSRPDRHARPVVLYAAS